MVNALREVRRVLKQWGVLIDVRPVIAPMVVEVVIRPQGFRRCFRAGNRSRRRHRHHHARHRHAHARTGRCLPRRSPVHLPDPRHAHWSRPLHRPSDEPAVTAGNSGEITYLSLPIIPHIGPIASRAQPCVMSVRLHRSRPPSAKHRADRKSRDADHTALWSVGKRFGVSAGNRLSFARSGVGRRKESDLRVTSIWLE